MEFSDFEKPDKDLIEILRAENMVERERGWRLIYKAYFPVVRELVWNNRGTDEDFHDIFQEGLAILHANLINGKFKKESSIGTYLYSICRNIWLRTLRNRDKERLSIAEMIEDVKADENKLLIDVEIIPLLLSEMQDGCSKILIDFYYKNRSLEELKSELNVKSIQVVKNKKYRCLGYLRKLFAERSIISHPE